MRVARGLGSLLVLLVGLIGVPVALLVIGRTLVPDSVSLSAALGALLRPDDGSVVLRLLLIVAAVAWLVFAVSALAEIVGFVSGYRIALRLPGLGGPQRLVAGLLLGVVAMISVPQPVQAAPTEVAEAAPLAGSGQPAAAAPRAAPASVQRAVAPTRTGSDDHIVLHRVALGDDLWSLAEHYYGNGRDWRKIAAANPDRLTGGPDRLQVGWQLRIPDAPRRSAPPEADRVVVSAGDTLSAIAERLYGDGSRWPELYEANRDRLDDPDELRIGMTLAVPDHDESPRRAAPSDAKTDAKTEAKTDRTPGDTAEPDEPAARPSPGAPRPPTVDGSDRQRADEPPAPPPAAAPERAPADRPGESAATPAPTASTAAADIDRGLAAALAGIGGLLAAGFVAGLVARRRLQLQARPVGRRILHPGFEAQRVEAIVGRRARPLTVRSLDCALRAISAHAYRTGRVLPRIDHVRVDEDRITLELANDAGTAPAGFTVEGRRWTVDAAGIARLGEIEGLDDATRPYPAMVTVGVDDAGAAVLLDLEATGLLGLASPDPRVVDAALLALGTELAFSPSADEMFLTVVGGSAALTEALAKHNVTSTGDVGALLDRLEARAAEQRREAPDGPARQRIDPDLADPWAPEVLLIAQPLDEQHAERLRRLITDRPPITLAAVLAEPSVPCPVTLRYDGGSDDRDSDAARGAVLDPSGLRLHPQLIGAVAVPAVLELVRVTGDDRTTEAPWWSEQPPDPPPDPPPDSDRPTNVAYLSRRAESWSGQTTVDQPEEVAQMITSVESGAAPAHPVLRLLGPVELDAAAGALPPRAGKQCLEYCGWLLEHPGSTAPQMTAALAVAEGTRRSNMSRLRTWLGTTEDGEAYLPDAYTGRITLHPAVSSDWHWLQIFTAGGVRRAGDDALHAALGLVRGAPLADAAPGQWHWAEELRTDMISAVRDIGVELSRRCLDDGDIDGARWSAARALLAAPGDELLMVARIRTEHRAGNRAEVERLTLQVAAQARQLGVDLTEETVVALQEVMEGRARARLA